VYYFIADEHYNHPNMLEYQDNPFEDIIHKEETMISNHNSVVRPNDTTVHGGDFAWVKTYREAQKYIKRLNGNHIFLKGSHDKWLHKDRSIQIWEKEFGKRKNRIYLVVCHYWMGAWARSHYNSWHLYGHSHHDLDLPGKRHCISVENTNYFPLSFEEVEPIMEKKGDNPNYIPPDKRHPRRTER